MSAILPSASARSTSSAEEAFAEQLRRLYGGPRPARNIRDRRLRNLASVIEATPDDWRAIQASIKQTGLSMAYLSVRFKEEAQLPMRSYALWRKFERACLLVASGMSAREAACLAGFSDQSHMGRAARRFAHKSFGQVQGEMAKEEVATKMALARTSTSDATETLRAAS